MVSAAAAKSRATGYLDGASLAEVFAWLRPGDLVWNYWVNNYLLGKRPPAFDVLYWNADTTRMAAQLHADFLRPRDRQLADRAGRDRRPRHARRPVPGHRRLLRRRRASPTTSARGRTATAARSMLGGRSRFVLSTNGHIAVIVNPPGNKKSSFRASDEPPDDPQEWLEKVERDPGQLVGRLRRVAQPSGRGQRRPRRRSSATPSTRSCARRPATYVFAK